MARLGYATHGKARAQMRFVQFGKGMDARGTDLSSKGVDMNSGDLSSKGIVRNRIERQRKRWNQISRGEASCSNALMVVQRSAKRRHRRAVRSDAKATHSRERAHGK